MLFQVGVHVADVTHFVVAGTDLQFATDRILFLCRRIPMFQVGVHIADVTHFVAAGSALDEEAASRSTSTYLVERRLDMLPGILTETLCSLKPNVDR